ncbi:MAG: nucleotide exchange factor GrpE [Candidatus Saccharimonadales bacterium]
MTDKKKQQTPAQDQPSEEVLTLLQQQVADLTDALQRERADVSNVRRRHEEQIAGLKNTVKANVVRDLLPIVDNFERALKHVPEDLIDNDYIKGVQGVVKQFEKTLTDMGVLRIKTVGEPFDPTFHEAVSVEDGDGTNEVVSEELQAGYTLGNEVIRHAMVRVTLQ